MSGSTYFVTPQNYGAVGDGKTDDTGAFQKAINAVSNVGGGALFVPPENYFFAGVLTLPAGVSLQGIATGPFDGVTSTNITSLGPVMLVTNKQSSFISIAGGGCGITDLIFYYPSQAKTSASQPIVYQPTISVSASGAGAHIARNTAINSYQFIQVLVGRIIIENNFIGCYFYGIMIDLAEDVIFLRDNVFQVFYDVFEGASVPSKIDAWVAAQGYALFVNRCDSLRVDGMLSFYKYAGIYLGDSANTSISPRNGYGSFSNIDIDSCQYGVVAASTNDAASGYKFSNLDVGAFGNGGTSALILQKNTNANSSPQILIVGGSIRGSWSGGVVQNLTGNSSAARIAYWQGYN